MAQLYERLPRKKHSREDGFLVELVSMRYADEPFGCVHTYMVSFAPAATRAGHFHEKKEEWLCVTCGKIELTLEDRKTKETEKIVLDSQSDGYDIIHIPRNVAHLLRNLSETEGAGVVVFAREPEDTNDTIKYEFTKK